MGGRSNIHPGVVKDEILDIDQFSREPDAGARIFEMASGDKALGDGA
jgi:hypothetical protein